MTVYDDEQNLWKEQIKAIKESNKLLTELNKTLLQVLGQMKVR